MQNPHHRFWAHSINPSYPPPPPGVLSGGPNNIAMTTRSRRRCAATARRRLAGPTNAEAYSINEVAINWNAPLVWVSAWIAQTEKRK